MSVIASVPATFSFATGLQSQAVTFAIPLGSWTSATIFVSGNAVPMPTFAVPYPTFEWTVSTEVDTFAGGSYGGGVYTNTAAVGSGGMSDINAAAGGNVSGTLNWDSTVAISITSLTLTVVGTLVGQTAYADVID